MKRFQAKLCALSAALALAAGCGDRAAPAAPELSARADLVDGALRILAAPLQPVHVLRRTKTLRSDVTVTARIGAAGGTIEIPEAGLTVTFPAGSVPVQGSETLRVGVTAVRGNGVAYLFEPHGIVFRRPVTLVQSLKPTGAFRKAAYEGRLQAAYFPDASYLDPDGTARVLELRPTVADVAAGTMTWTVEHFSGYLASVGRDAGPQAESQAQ